MYSLRTYLYHQCSTRFIRWSSSSNGGDKAASKKQMNYVNKTLFGAVTRKGKPKSAEPVKECDSPEFEPNDTKKSPADYKSEMYWLLEHKAVVNPIPKQKRTQKAVVQKQKTPKISGDIPAKTVKLVKNKTSPKIDIGSLKDSPKKKSKSAKAKLEASTPIELTQFNDSLCKPPVKRGSKKTVAKLGVSDDRLSEILSVPPFELANWCSNVENMVVGTDRMEVRQMPSVSKVLQATMSESSRNALMQWKLLKIAELGAQGFEDLQQSHLSAGSNFHLAIQSYFQTRQVPDARSPVFNVWSSVESALAEIDPDTELVESPIVHPVLQYKGIVDCVSRVDGKLSVIEWKKSDRPKTCITNTYDAPVQLCAYLGAINADPRYSLEVRNGLVVVAYTSGGPAHAFRMDEHSVAKYWRIWLHRLHEYWVRHRDGTLPEPI